MKIGDKHKHKILGEIELIGIIIKIYSNTFEFILPNNKILVEMIDNFDKYEEIVISKENWDYFTFEVRNSVASIKDLIDLYTFEKTEEIKKEADKILNIIKLWK